MRMKTFLFKTFLDFKQQQNNLLKKKKTEVDYDLVYVTQKTKNFNFITFCPVKLKSPKPAELKLISEDLV